MLYILAVTSIGVYGIVLAGWASGSTYPLLGGLRSSAQVISYEIAMGLSLVAVFIPVAFMGGMIGKIFLQFGVTVAFAVLVAILFRSLSVVVGTMVAAVVLMLR